MASGRLFPAVFSSLGDTTFTQYHYIFGMSRHTNLRVELKQIFNLLKYSLNDKCIQIPQEYLDVQ